MSRQRTPSVAAPAQGEERLSFEAALEQLEGVVERLERGELPLEEALTAFEEGVALVKRCAAQLDAAERRIDVLVREGERWLERPFEEEEQGG
jgi:exodeoxyribonuclease VII small subunit